MSNARNAGKVGRATAGRAAKAGAASRQPAPSPSRAPSPPRAPKRRTQAERTETTRKLILDAAIGIMRRKGVAGLRTGEVADAAGVSRGALLHHFPTKDDLILEALHHVNDKALRASRERALFAKRGHDPIDAIVADACEYFFGDGFFVELGLAVGQTLDPEMRRIVNLSTRRSRFSVERTWREALEAANLPAAIAADILAITLSIVRGFAVRRFLDDNPAQVAHLIEVWREMVRLYLDAHGRRGSAPATAPTDGGEE
jgi:AcrR family transcriptional regulator